jgi:hypothetical protein
MYTVPNLGTSPMMNGVWEVINFLISVRESLIDRKGGGKSASCLVLRALLTNGSFRRGPRV